MLCAPAHNTHLDLLGTTCQTARLAAGVLGTLALGSGVLTHGVGGNDVHMGCAGVHLGRVVGIRDVVVGWSSGAGRRVSRRGTRRERELTSGESRPLWGRTEEASRMDGKHDGARPWFKNEMGGDA